MHDIAMGQRSRESGVRSSVRSRRGPGKHPVGDLGCRPGVEGGDRADFAGLLPGVLQDALPAQPALQRA